jgi:hypothetical protein
LTAWKFLLLGATAPSLVFATPVESRSQADPPVPPGWTVDTSASGDLTGDGISDIALVIRRDDPKLRLQNEGMGQAELDTNPRRLLVFAKTSNGFRQIAAADRLIPPSGSEDAVCLEDPLAEGGISIARRVLSVNLHYWLSCGGWSVTVNTFKFRLDSGRFRLIGFDQMQFMRNSGEGEQVSVNFLSGRKSSTPFAIDDSIPKRLRWSRIRPVRFYLDSLDIKSCQQIDESTDLC